MRLALLVSFGVLTYPSLCGLQLVSAPRLVGFFRRPDLSLPVWSPVGERTLLCWFLSVSLLVPPCAVSRK
jgi:hypothetical protein